MIQGSLIASFGIAAREDYRNRTWSASLKIDHGRSKDSPGASAMIHINRSVLLIEFCNLDYRYLSGTGQSRPNWAVRAMSGLPPSATELRTSLVVRFVP
jgi:hypothetical protein